MNPCDLPETVVEAWGAQASQAFMDWLGEYLPTLGVTAQVPISAFVARQKVNVLLLEQVSNLLLADEPTLKQAATGQWQWHVPIDLTYPSYGRVGNVGEIIVDAHYGRMFYDDALLDSFTSAAERLAEEILN